MPTHPDMKPQAAPTSGPVAQLSPQKPREASPQDTNWESLIDLREDEGDPNETQPTAAPAQRPPWNRPAVAAGVLLLGLVAAGAGGLLRVGTPYGTILIEGLSDDDIVEVDGQRIPNITIRKTPNGEPFLKLTAEKHGIRVRTKDGIEIFSRDVTVKANGSKSINVSVEPRVKPRAGNELPDATTRPANGLLAEFFEGREFDRKLKARVDEKVDWLWGCDGPDPEMPRDNFSARWTGWLKALDPAATKSLP